MKPKITRLFEMKGDTAMLFFIIVMWTTDHGVEDSESLRNYILNWLAKNGAMERVYDTKRTQDQIIADYKKNGLKVLHIKSNQEAKSNVSSRDDKDNVRMSVGRFFRELWHLVKVLFGGASL